MKTQLKTQLNSKQSMIFLVIMLMLSTACSSQSEDLNQDFNVEAKSEQSNAQLPPSSLASFAGDGDRGGYEVVSAYVPAGCVAYKIASRVFVSTGSCLAECIEDTCDIAVMNVGPEPSLLGLATQVAVSTTRRSEADQAIGLIFLNKDSDTLVKPIIEQAPAYQMLGETQEVSSLQGPIGYLSSSTTCPNASVAITDTYGSLFGLSLARQGRCNEFLYLNHFYDFISAGLRPGFQSSGFEPEANLESEQANTQEQTEQAEADQATLESYWASKEADALSRAPSCENNSETYCDGEVEMRCSGNSYQALHCGRVGWVCNSESSWGPSCEPNE